MADQKLIDITDLLRQEQQKTTSELITTRHSIQMMSNDIAEGLSFLPSKDESQGMSDIQSIEYSLELANVRDDLRNGFQSVVDAVNGLSGILEKTKQVTIENKGIFLSRLLSRETQEEEERESDQQHAEIIDALGKDGSGEGGEDSKKGGFLKKMLSGVVGFPIKMIKGLFSALGSVGKLFLKFGAFLLKPLAFIGTLGGALTSTAALVTGLGAIAALFAGVGVASFMLTDAEFDKLKEDIAKGVANVFSKIVSGAVDIYNAFVPESMQVSEADKQKFETATFTAVKDTIIGIIDFVKDISDAFGEGFMKNFDGIKTKFDDFVTKIGLVYDKITALLADAFEDAGGRNTLMSVVTLIGDGIGKVIDGILSVANFLLDLIIDPKTTMKNLLGDIEKFFSDLGDDIKKFVTDTFTSIKTSISNFFSDLKTRVTTFISDLFTFEGEEGEKITIVDKIVEMFAQLMQTIKEKITGFSLFGGDDEESAAELEKERQEEIAGIDSEIEATKGLKVREGFLGIGERSQEDIDNMIRELEARKAGIIKGSLARGGVIVNKPAYLPSSGVVIGESPVFSGRGLARGGVAVPDGGSEAVIPFDQRGIQIMTDAIGKPVAGATLNELQVARTMVTNNVSSEPVVIDNSQQPTIINQTNVSSPQTRGNPLPGMGRDMSVSHLRYG